MTIQRKNGSVIQELTCMDAAMNTHLKCFKVIPTKGGNPMPMGSMFIGGKNILLLHPT